MTTGSDKCSISSIIPMSCRDKAEAFARRLHSRLSSLGTSADDGLLSVDENTWLAAAATRDANSIAISQPRHSDPDLFFDLALVESPGSPEEEVPQIELARLITNDNDNLNLISHGDDCHCSKQQNPNVTLGSLGSNGHNVSPGSDSSSEGQYFDPDERLVFSDDVDSNIRKSNTNGSVNSLSCTSEESTCSLQDFPSLEYGNSLLQSDTSAEDNPFLTPQESNDSETSNYSQILNGSHTEECDKTNLDEEENNSTISSDKTESDFVQNGSSEYQNGKDDREFYCSTLRVENELTVDIDDKRSDLINEIELEINNDDDSVEDHEDVIPRVRRCSSLKTGKTPPGTPGRKKIVRFADVLGLDLADVRTFLDEIPKIPNSAYADLNADLSFTSEGFYDSGYKRPSAQADKILVALFQQPGGEANFLDRVRDNQVCLENAVVEDPIALSIKGTVRVRNLDFNKSVYVRYSLDSWKTYSDLQASYAENSCDGFSDKFSFLMYVNTVTVGQRVEFAVKFHCKGLQYWDNNSGMNYCFQCLPVTNTNSYTPITGCVEDSWGASFYYKEGSALDERELSWHRQAAVQEYIAAKLEKHKKSAETAIAKRSNPDLLGVIVIIVFSIVFLYIQKAIYFK